jgi:hypothetical protein
MGKKLTVSNKTPYSCGSSLVLLEDSSEYGNENLGSTNNGKFYE